MRETIPLQILDPFIELCAVSHTFSRQGSNARIAVWVDERSVGQDGNRGQDDPTAGPLLGRPCLQRSVGT
jgi:hypothetical protein